MHYFSEKALYLQVVIPRIATCDILKKERFAYLPNENVGNFLKMQG